MILETKSLSKSYYFKNIVTDIDLKIPKGSVYCLAGLNGAGKTTIISMLSGIKNPSSGQVLFNGKDIRSSMKYYYGSMGYFPQDSTLPEMRLTDALVYMATLKGLTKDESLDEISRFISYFNMKDVLNIHLRKLSHGQKKLVSIMQAFLNNPDIVLLDEPFAGLDPLHKLMLKRFIMDNKHTLVINTHMLDEVEEICTDLSIIHEGRLISQSKTTRYKKKLKDVFLSKVSNHHK